MVKLKLNDNYSNDFLTTIRGDAFFRDWQKQNRPEWVEVADEVYEKDHELRSLIRQGILIMKKDNKENKEEVKRENKEEVKENKKNKDNKEEIKFGSLKD